MYADHSATAPTADNLRIGERTGRSIHAIRWYESQGLIPGVARDAGGRRVYSPLHVGWLDLMDRLRRTGMSIAEMRDYTALDELAKGNGRPFIDSLADDFCWTLTGTTSWSGTYRGKEAVQKQLLRPLFAQFADQYVNTAQRFTADDDHVVVECRGRVTTKSGKPYHNAYCGVCRLADGRLKEVTEYMDTERVATALGDKAMVG